jgi:hypothetical protein
MNNNFKDYLSASEVSRELNVSVKTLTGWYKWYTSEIPKPENVPTLPMYVQEHERSPRLWNPDDLDTLKKFKEWVPRGRNGVMGRINEQYWSKKNKKSEEVTE